MTSGASGSASALAALIAAIWSLKPASGLSSLTVMRTSSRTWRAPRRSCTSRGTGRSSSGRPPAPRRRRGPSAGRPSRPVRRTRARSAPGAPTPMAIPNRSRRRSRRRRTPSRRSRRTQAGRGSGGQVWPMVKTGGLQVERGRPPDAAGRGIAGDAATGPAAIVRPIGAVMASSDGDSQAAPARRSAAIESTTTSASAGQLGGRGDAARHADRAGPASRAIRRSAGVSPTIAVRSIGDAEPRRDARQRRRIGLGRPVVVAAHDVLDEARDAERRRASPPSATVVGRRDRDPAAGVAERPEERREVGQRHRALDRVRLEPRVREDPPRGADARAPAPQDRTDQLLRSRPSCRRRAARWPDPVRDGVEADRREHVAGDRPSASRAPAGSRGRAPSRSTSRRTRSASRPCRRRRGRSRRGSGGRRLMRGRGRRRTIRRAQDSAIACSIAARRWPGPRGPSVASGEKETVIVSPITAAVRLGSLNWSKDRVLVADLDPGPHDRAQEAHVLDGAAQAVAAAASRRARRPRAGARP